MTVIRAQGVRRAFGKVQALDGLDLEVEGGQVFGFLGPNGAGKTTTLQVLLGILPPDAGTLEVLGRQIPREGGYVRRRCGVLLEHDGLYERLTVRQNLRYALHQRGIAGYLAERRIDDVLGDAGFLERGDDRAGTFSRGMKRRLGILRAFVAEPELVFLDEPTSGFDPAHAAELRRFLREFVKDQEATVFLTTHDMAEAEEVCDDVAIIRAGRLLAQGRPGSLHEEQPKLIIEGTGIAPKHVALLKRRKVVADATAADGRLEITLHGHASAAPLVKALVQAGVGVEAVRPERPSLQQEFISLVSQRPGATVDTPAQETA